MRTNMKLRYDIFNRTEPSDFYLAKPGKRILGKLNGIKQDTCNVELNINNTSVLTCDIDRIVDGEISNYYDRLEQHYEIYVTGIGWFKINEEPEVSNDGNTETTSIRAESLEIELQQYDLVGFKINCGSEDSWEMMATDNIYEDEDGYKLPRDSVLFYRDTSELEKLIIDFSNSDGTISSLESLAYKYPCMFNSWRINYNLKTIDSAIQSAIDEMKTLGKDTSVLETYIGAEHTKESIITLCNVYPYILKYVDIVLDNSSDIEGEIYTITEILNRELEREHQLSLMWLLLNDHCWSVGYVDDFVNTESPKKLCNMVGKFDVSTQDTYSFITQDVANYYRCIFVFDTDNCKVNVYKIENLGSDTNICLNFSNVQNSIQKSSDKKIYTVFHVSNNDDLNIREANIGEDAIEDISYFLNTDHFSQEFIDKYNSWKEYREEKRIEYLQLSKDYRNQNDIVTELYYRVPTDLVDTSQYSTFSDEQLLTEKSDCEAQLRGYENYYVDEYGNFNLDKLQSSEDWKTYKLIKEIIIPNIEVEIYNRGIDDKNLYKDFNDDYKYKFDTYGDSYGVKELEICRDTIKNNIEALEKNGYGVPSETGDEYHKAQYELYLKYKDALTSCLKVLEERKSEYDLETEKLNTIVNNQDAIKSSISKKNESFGFTEKELSIIEKYYVHTDYINENIVVTSLDDNDSKVDLANELYEDALEELYAESHPQWKFSTTQDNLFIMPEFKDWHGDLDIANFIRVSIRDDYQVKLRIISISLNPLMIDPEINLTFSNMIQYKSKRNDAASILGNSGGSSKNQITGTTLSNNQKDDTFNIDSTFIRKLINNGLFSGNLSSVISNSIQSNNGTISNMVNDRIDSAEINVGHIKGESGEFEEFFSKYIDSNYINSKVVISDIGEFKDLKSLVAAIDNLLAGRFSAELGHLIKLTAENVSIDESVIRNLIAAQITVSMLQAGDISSDSFHIISDSGGLTIVGDTMQFSDADGNIRIQIGRDANNDFTFVLYDETGTGVLIDSTGIKESAIADGLIVNDMVANGTLEKNKFAFDVLEGDGNGNLDAGKVIVDGHGVDVEFTSIKQTITETNSRIDNLTSQIASIELMGEQIFKQIQGVVSPETITVTAVCRNGAMIGNWYINDVLVTDTEYVSDDKTSITIPSSYMLDNNIVPIKVTDSTAELYDLHTLYLISDSTGVKGDDAYTVILQNENVNFSVDNSSNTVLSDQSFSSTVQIFQGTTERTDFTLGEINSVNGITVSIQDKTVILSVKNGDKITENNGFFTVPILIDDLTFYKDITWNLAKQGETGSSGEPSLNIVVGNESQNIPCSNEGLVLENFLIEIPFTGYKGFNRVGCSVSVGLLPDGVTLGSNTASTPDTEGLIILNVSKDATLGGASVLNGKVTLTFTIDGKNMSRYFTWVKTKDGAEGSMILYELGSSSPVLNKNYDDTLSPSTITFNSYYRQSNSTDKTSYAGQFIIAESDNDGATYTNKYLSTVVEDFVDYTPSSASITSIRCTLCSADDISIELDVLTVPVLTDVDSIKPIITEITTTMSGVESKVDSVEKSITDKVWQDDITNSINNYNNTTVEEIRSRVSQVEQDVNGIKSTVSDVQTTLTEKADGSTVTELSEKVSTLEQNADGFKQTVEKNYVAKADLNISSRNLLRNSKTLIFDSYGLVNSEGINYLIDESGNILTDEVGNLLIL